MARVTVEDCIEKVTNRFDLVLCAGQRARQISSGAELTIDRDNDKNPVVALREIADGTVLPAFLEEAMIVSHQQVVSSEDEAPDDTVSLAASAAAMRMSATQPPRPTVDDDADDDI